MSSNVQSSSFVAFSGAGHVLGSNSSSHASSSNSQGFVAVPAQPRVAPQNKVLSYVKNKAYVAQRTCTNWKGRACTWVNDHSADLKKWGKIGAIAILAATVMVGLPMVAPAGFAGQVLVTAASLTTSIATWILISRAVNDRPLFS